jgi:hypothetical protein
MLRTQARPELSARRDTHGMHDSEGVATDQHQVVSPLEQLVRAPTAEQGGPDRVSQALGHPYAVETGCSFPTGGLMY